MDIFTDYANWKIENYEMIQALITLKSKVISRFSHVIAVVDYLYNEKIKNKDMETYLEDIFDSGFNYLYDRFQTISQIAKEQFRGNIQELDKIAKTINLLLYTDDFLDEIYNVEYKKEDLNRLEDFEQKVYEYVEKHEIVPDEMFGLLDDITYPIFKDEYQGVNEIMYEVALDLDLIQEDDFEAVDIIFGNKK
jgi:hypothetical protein